MGAALVGAVIPDPVAVGAGLPDLVQATATAASMRRLMVRTIGREFIIFPTQSGFFSASVVHHPTTAHLRLVAPVDCVVGRAKFRSENRIEARDVSDAA